MRFIVDAQLPRLLAGHLVAAGHDAIHVKQLPQGGESTDAEIARIADRENRIVITKDIDFQDSHLVLGTPRRLLRVNTGNIANANLIALFSQLARAMEAAFVEVDYVVLSADGLTAYPRSTS